MIANNVEVDKDKLAEAMRLVEHVGDNAANAIRIAINKTMLVTRNQSIKSIAGQVRLTPQYIRSKVKTTRATLSRLNGKIRTEKRGLLATKYSTDEVIANDTVRWFRPPKSPEEGVKIKVKPNGQEKIIGPGKTGVKAFYIVLPNSKVIAIATRNSRKREDIKVSYGPSISQVFTDVREDVTPDAQKELAAQLDNAMQYILNFQGPPEPPDDV